MSRGSDERPRKRGIVPTVLLVALGVFPCLAAHAQAPHVTAPAGRIIGVNNGTTEGFLGIDYAMPPVGERRWRLSAPMPHSRRPLGATVQHEGCAALISGDAFETHNENCLSLNVYRPRATPPGAHLPVIVFVHGGGNQSGTPAIYDGSALAAAEHAIVVIPAYRLGIFGYLALPQDGDGPAPTGDLAIGDLLNALRWVHANIAAFGGDPATVTLAGESAGAANVCDLLTAPASAGLFSQAIMESGFCPARSPLAISQAIGMATAREAGCTGPHALACLRDKPVPVLLASWDKVWQQPTVRLENGTVVQRPLFPTAPYGTSLQPVSGEAAIRRGTWHAVPVLIGFNRDELRGFLAGYFPMTRAAYDAVLTRAYPTLKDQLTRIYPLDPASPLYTLATIRSDQMFICPALRGAALFAPSTSVSVYEFADRTAPAFHSLALKLPEPEGFERGAAHTAELAYLFGYKSIAAPLSAKQSALSHQMMTMWMAFGRTGTNWPTWTPRDPTSMIIADKENGGIRKSSDISSVHHCDFWDRYPAIPNSLFP
ncbi:MAG: carboxylesterase family protein [Gluconacetobacter liquefaciens]